MINFNCLNSLTYETHTAFTQVDMIKQVLAGKHLQTQDCCLTTTFYMA
ncbi:hypothetical protein FNL37_2278 [Methylovorus glucosotrophus]|nr:hypothetical protein FNL37_2278 [Methylovorus glucosotrophus]